MAKLRRVSDGAGDEGSRVEAIQWDENGVFEKVVDNKPVVGCSLLVGSVTARSYSEKDFWLTTPVSEILEEKYSEKDPNRLVYSKFKTGNSIYELWK